MSLDAIRDYQKEVADHMHRGGSGNESIRRFAFQKLLETYAKAKDLKLISEVGVVGRKGKTVYPDGTLKDILRQDWGYWECKDEYDDLEQEVTKKFELGYPNDNILFEDGIRALLYQNGNEVSRVSFDDAVCLDKILKSFINYQRTEVAEFRNAIELFKSDVPKITSALRELIVTKAEHNKTYLAKMNAFLTLCREVINPNISKEDIREMVIQHILTADIFNTIFDEPNFHRENNIACELQALVDTFFTREIRSNTLAGIKHYYDTINARAAQIADHHEKQMFLKVVYETFYKSYDPKKADRLGVVYTPNEIVRFMIESTDYLLGKHFGKHLEDKNVEILDPATGTGTFICDIIDHLPKKDLPYKYKHELHANEVEILPYYIANLNIEFTYKQKTGQYAEFDNLCFVDTLDNMGFVYRDKQDDIFSLTDENAERIRKQNEKKISVIIGNPPYNANQMNENENNKNREYTIIDKRIKDTYIKHSTAQKTKVYDMYARFYRWAMDRLNENGILTYITNRSFIDSRTFDGFRKCIMQDFDYAYIIDTKSDVRQNPKIAGTTHNVFGIQTGVAIMLLVKHSPKQNKDCRIEYIAMEDNWRKEDKLLWLNQHHIKDILFKHIQPDKNNNWINLTENDWDDYIDVKKIFSLISLGVSTNRDEWVFDFDNSALGKKMNYFVEKYNELLNNKDDKDESIKWSSSLRNRFNSNKSLNYEKEIIIDYVSRPYIKTKYYADKSMSDRLTQNHYDMFGYNLKSSNNVIALSGISSSKPFAVLTILNIFSLDLLEKTQSLPLYRYDQDGKRHDNITDWALAEFRKQYQDKNISKEGIFHYVYGVLHNPAYRIKYEQNLKRSLPRIPYYEDFYTWAKWGKQLMELHLNYETVEPYPLEHETHENGETHENKKENLGDSTSLPLSVEKTLPKAKLKADKDNGIIILDTQTTLSGVPPEAWEYKLGNRSALEWILDQYKEKKPKDPTIAKLFNTYRFADYKDKVIDLLQRVTTVSIDTMKIVREMEKIEVHS